MRFLTKISSILALGVPNLIRVFQYRMGLKLGLSSAMHLQGVAQSGPFFVDRDYSAVEMAPPIQWEEAALLFGHWEYSVTSAPPDWHCNPLTGARVDQPQRNWWEIPDFDAQLGDIKLVWELSRLDWLLAFAQRFKAGDNQYHVRLESWLTDWCANNPPYKGVNWKCGQEASIRVMHLIMASLILEQTGEATPALLELINQHLRRIAPTVSYAMAQDNNHGTSEAAALYIGGSFLAHNGRAEGVEWAHQGSRWLENRAQRLIGVDGSFSQYSLNYHRLMLDTFSMVEVWRRHLSLPRFSDSWYSRAAAATNWLRSMVRDENGEAPNLGANDGARLLQLGRSDYRDFRPSVQLAMNLFWGRKGFGAGRWDEPIRWLGLKESSETAVSQGSQVFDEGGFAVLRNANAMAMLRFPRFRFRPSQADALHVDLWVGADNLLRDAGTYSYNTEAKWLNYFPGTAAHNTVQFDGRDQMPRISRFLFGRWLKTSHLEPLQMIGATVSFAAGYKDASRAEHKRKIVLGEDSLMVVDDISGVRKSAVLRWRLRPGEWQLEGNRLSCGDHVIEVLGTMPIIRLELVEGWESLYYLDKTQVPILELEVSQSGSLTTKYSWSL
ncbi:alginate lyase family protein [Pseudomonas sp. PMCC200344]|uniref:heparinase II/III family protein n=1 Tax=Pseudomonas sp. PMCC200344 TaxID=3042028 RepID=UPI0024B3288B|nr:alginate lyase family protein [Pseudomonas sp. PMCC200344]